MGGEGGERWGKKMEKRGMVFYGWEDGKAIHPFNSMHSLKE